MKIDYKLLPDDLLEASQAHAGPRNWKRLFLIWFALLVVATLLFQAIQSKRAKPGLASNPGISFSQVFPALVIVGVLLAMPQIRRWEAKKRWSANRNLQYPVEMQFTEAGIESSNTIGKTSSAWTSFLGFRETENLFVLLQDGKRVQLISKRELTPDTVSQIRKLLKERVPTPA